MNDWDKFMIIENRVNALSKSLGNNPRSTRQEFVPNHQAFLKASGCLYKSSVTNIDWRFYFILFYLFVRLGLQ